MPELRLTRPPLLAGGGEYGARGLDDRRPCLRDDGRARAHAGRVRRYAERHGMTYPLLLAGTRTRRRVQGAAGPRARARVPDDDLPRPGRPRAADPHRLRAGDGRATPRSTRSSCGASRSCSPSTLERGRDLEAPRFGHVARRARRRARALRGQRDATHVRSLRDDALRPSRAYRSRRARAGRGLGHERPGSWRRGLAPRSARGRSARSARLGHRLVPGARPRIPVVDGAGASNWRSSRPRSRAASR